MCGQVDLTGLLDPVKGLRYKQQQGFIIYNDALKPDVLPAYFRHTDLLGAAFKHHVLLTLVQPSLLQRPEVKNSVFSLQELIQDG